MNQIPSDLCVHLCWHDATADCFGQSRLAAHSSQFDRGYSLTSHWAISCRPPVFITPVATAVSARIWGFSDSIITPGITPGRNDQTRKPKYLQNELVARQYREIGQALAICESASIDAGIVWLPPTPERIKLCAKFEGPVREFLRLALVTVSSKTLESYCDDLEQMPLDAQSAGLLSLPSPKLWERFFLSLLSFALFFTVFLFCSRALGVETGQYLLAVAAAVTGGGLCAAMCFEHQRRRNFYSHLYNELLRRQGLDQSGASAVKLFSVKSDPAE